MSNYRAFKRRQENASPYANEANCRKCKHGKWAKTQAFCNGFDAPKAIPYSHWDTDKIGYCTQYYPKPRN